MRKTYLKKFKNLFFIFAAFAILSCGKDGTMGPEGQKGAQGEQGVKGADGSTVHSGSGAPTSTLGQVGDFYLDKGTTNLYGPKTAASWGEPLSLKGSKGDTGEKGSDGADGSKMLSGTGNPAASLGSNGDFYFDTEQIAFYGPKTSSGWGSLISLKAANENGIKVVNMKDFKLNISFTYIGYKNFLSELTIIPVPDYNNFYEDGVVLISFRNPKDIEGAWTNSVVQEFNFPGEIYASHLYIFNEDIRFVRGGIVLFPSVNFSKSSIEFDPEDVQFHLKQMKENFSTDIKIVLIPGTQVKSMKQQNVDVRDVNAISDFLNL